MKLIKSSLILVAATATGTSIGDQANIRGKKVSGIIALSGSAPNGTALVAPSAAYITLQNAAGQIIHEDLPMSILQPSANGGLIQEFGDQLVDWTKSSVKGAGLVGFSVVHE